MHVLDYSCFPHSIDICTVAIKNIRNMQAVLIKLQIFCLLTIKSNKELV